jgi:hypothetical protein
VNYLKRCLIVTTRTPELNRHIFRYLVATRKFRSYKNVWKRRLTIQSLLLFSTR